MQRRDAAVRDGLKAGSSLDSIASRVATATRQGINEVRAVSRASGVARLKSEAAQVGRAIIADPSWLSTEVVRDINRASTYSESYARQWLKKANEAAEKTDAVTKAAKAASADTIGSLKRTAVTESSEAFSSGRAKYLRSSSSLGLLRVWDARLDKRTCPICGAADGTIVGAREPFPLGEPGSVHPGCLCSWSLLSSSQDDGGTLIEPRTPTVQVAVPAAPVAAPSAALGGGRIVVTAETKALAKRLDVALGGIAKDGGAAARTELRALLGQHGIKARSLGSAADTIKLTDPSDMGGMAGFHEWDGSLRLAPKTVTDARGALRKLQLGVDPSDDQLNALSVLIHEEIHGASAMTKAAFQGPGAAIEEVATELAARRVTGNLVGRQVGAVYNDEIAGLTRALGRVSKAKPEALAKRIDAAVDQLKSKAGLAKTPAQHIDNFVDGLKLTPKQSATLKKSLAETEWWKPGQAPAKTARPKAAPKTKTPAKAKPKKAQAPPKKTAAEIRAAKAAEKKAQAEAAKLAKAQVAAEKKAAAEAKKLAAAEAKAAKARLAAEAKAARAKAKVAKLKRPTKAKKPPTPGLTAAELREVEAAEKAWLEAEKLQQTAKPLASQAKATTHVAPVGQRTIAQTADEFGAALRAEDGATARNLLREHIGAAFPEAVSKDIKDGAVTLLRRDIAAHGYHDVAGRIVINEEIYDRAAKGMAQLASGEMNRAAGMSAGERFMAYAGQENPYFNIDPIRVFMHEGMHGFSRSGKHSYAGVGALLEEVGTELSARHAMTKLGPGFEKLYSGLASTGSGYEQTIEQVTGILRKHIPGTTESDARYMLLNAHRKAALTDGPKFSTPEEHLDAIMTEIGAGDSAKKAIREEISRLALPDDD